MVCLTKYNLNDELILDQCAQRWKFQRLKLVLTVDHSPELPTLFRDHSPTKCSTYTGGRFVRISVQDFGYVIPA